MASVNSNDLSVSTSLVQRLHDGSDGAWRELVQQYSVWLLRVCQRCGLDQTESADVVQQTLLLAFRGIGTFARDKGCFKNWIGTICRHEAIKYAQRSAKHRATNDSEILRQLPQSSKDWDALFDEELLEIAKDLVRQQVKKTTWDCFQLTDLGGRSNREVAAELGITEGKVAVNKSRIRRRIGEEYRKLEGGE